MVDESTKQVKTKIRRVKGAGFPRLSLSGACDVIEKASKFGRQWTKEVFASFGVKKGKGSARSGAFTARLASLKYYGLVEVSEDLISRSELGDKIAKPINQQEHEEAIKEAFLNVELFKDVVETVERGKELKKDEIAEYAVKQLNVSRSSKDLFLRNFIESGKFAGLITEIDPETIKVEFPESLKQKPPEKERIIAEPPLVEAEEKRQPPSLDLVTTFGTRKFGKAWDVAFTAKLDIELDQNLLEKITKIIIDTEKLAKMLQEEEKKQLKKEEKNEGTTDN